MRNAIISVRDRYPFESIATVLLPHHLHTICTLPRGDPRYPLRWSAIKQEFTRTYLANGGTETLRSSSRIAKRERAVWQRRYWEHLCRNEADVKRLADYIHWNPCKHALVRHVKDYPWSTFHRFVELGEYELGWGNLDPCPNWSVPEWE